MREHLGVDVDATYEEDLMATKPQKPVYDRQPRNPDREERGKDSVTQVKEEKSGLGVGTASGQGMPSQVQVYYIFVLKDGLREGIYALGDIVHADVRKATGESNDQEPLEFNTSDKSLGEERTIESREHKRAHAFPSSIVPTMEGGVVMESLYSVPEDSVSSEESGVEMGDQGKASKQRNGDVQELQEHGNSAYRRRQDAKTNGDAQVLETKRDQEVKTPKSARSFGDPSMSSTIPDARVENGEFNGAPADASRDSKTDDQPPHAVSGKEDAAETEEKAVRGHLSTAKSNSKVWTLPTRTPKVDPHGFEDPICDEFWKKVWIACAVHNVGGSHGIWC